MYFIVNVWFIYMVLLLLAKQSMTSLKLLEEPTIIHVLYLVFCSNGKLLY